MKPLREWIKSLFDEHPPRRVLFRVDAGRIPGLSFGHLSRCLILSKLCKEFYRSENIFLMRDYPEGINHALQTGETVKILPKESSSREEQPFILNVAGEFEPDWMVFDLPYSDLDTTYYSILQNHGAKILFIDDFRFTNPGVDAVLNSSILAPVRMEMVHAEKTRYFLGPEYFIFDDDSRINQSVAKEGLINVVLTFGGSDPTGLVGKVLTELLEKQWPKTFFRVILGPGYVEPISVRSLLEDQGLYFGIEVNPPSIIPFLRGCDFVICAGGRTMYESLYLKKKFFPIATSDIESEAIAEFMRQKLTTDGMTNWNPKDFTKKLNNFLYSPQTK